MSLFSKDPQTVLRMPEGPLGQYIDSYAAEIRADRADDELLAFLKTL